jgi:hypothetical protein
MSNNLKNDFIAKWNKDDAYHAKNVYGNLLNWEDILNILNKEIRSEKLTVNFNNAKSNSYEIIYKDLIAMRKIADWNGPLIETDATFFFSLFFDTDKFITMVPESVINKINEINKMLDIHTRFVSLKIALSDKFVPYEYHKGNAIIIQLQGTNEWNLRNRTTQEVSSYLLEPGDCLLFKANTDHSLTNYSPRSSIVGSFTLGNSHE